MDPLTSLVTALAAGAAAALQSTVEQGVKDGYGALKGLIRPYSTVAAITPNKLYPIGGKESIPLPLFGGNFPYPQEPVLFPCLRVHHGPHSG